jgi:hypothetical protein
MAGQEASPGAHFSRTTARESTLTRASADVYRGNSKTGYTQGDWQAHHILCEHALGSRTFDDADQEFAEECLWVTEWDLNASPNMIGMPVRSDFRRANGAMGMNICSHANDHNTTGGYTEECKDFLQEKVWNKIKKGKKGHTTSPTDLAGVLNGASTYFRGQLTARSLREGGTLLAWTQRHEPGWPARWYRPFSMANDSAVVARGPGARSDIADKMVGLFQRIV